MRQTLRWNVSGMLCHSRNCWWCVVLPNGLLLMSCTIQRIATGTSWSCVAPSKRLLVMCWFILEIAGSILHHTMYCQRCVALMEELMVLCCTSLRNCQLYIALFEGLLVVYCTIQDIISGVLHHPSDCQWCMVPPEVLLVMFWWWCIVSSGGFLAVCYNIQGFPGHVL